MATAETVMAVYSDRGKRGLPLEGVYRQLYSRDLYLRAYGRIHRNDGAMTPGVTDETVDAMSLEKIDRIIDAMRQEGYRWTPVKTDAYPEEKRKKRPLGIPTWSDKLVQEACVSCLTPTTNRNSATTPTVFAKGVVATRRCARSPKAGGA